MEKDILKRIDELLASKYGRFMDSNGEEVEEPEDDDENYGDGYWVIAPLGSNGRWRDGEEVPYEKLYSGPFNKEESANKEREAIRKQMNRNTAVVYIKNNRISNVKKYTGYTETSGVRKF